jgi:hypothetical protein
MKARFLLLILSLLAFVLPASYGQQTGDALARLGMMRVMFKGFEEVLNPITKQKELVCYVSFIDLAIPKQPMVLRRGDKVAGYIMGTFNNREPKQTANDGIVPGTLPTLEIIQEESGEKHVLEPMRIYTVSRDR